MVLDKRVLRARQVLLVYREPLDLPDRLVRQVLLGELEWLESRVCQDQSEPQVLLESLVALELLAYKVLLVPLVPRVVVVILDSLVILDR